MPGIRGAVGHCSVFEQRSDIIRCLTEWSSERLEAAGRAGEMTRCDLNLTSVIHFWTWPLS